MLDNTSRPALGPADDCRAACPSVSLEIHQLAESLGNAIDAKDHHTRQHSDEVAVAAHRLALDLGLPAGQAGHIHIAGHLHDIGKIGVPDSILQKRGPLDEAQWAEIKRHPVIGAAIIAPVRFLRATGIAAMVYHHHEAYDGSGYPDGLAGRDIPLGARIIAVADSLSAMLQNRPYRRKMTFAEALGDIAALAGRRYDPAVVQALLRDAAGISGAIANLALAARAGPAGPRLVSGG